MIFVCASQVVVMIIDKIPVTVTDTDSKGIRIAITTAQFYMRNNKSDVPILYNSNIFLTVVKIKTTRLSARLLLSDEETNDTKPNRKQSANKYLVCGVAFVESISNVVCERASYVFRRVICCFYFCWNDKQQIHHILTVTLTFTLLWKSTTNHHLLTESFWLDRVE